MNGDQWVETKSKPQLSGMGTILGFFQSIYEKLLITVDVIFASIW